MGKKIASTKASRGSFKAAKTQQLFTAIGKHDAAKIRKLVQEGADPNGNFKTAPGKLTFRLNDPMDGDTPLTYAAGHCMFPFEQSSERVLVLVESTDRWRGMDVGPLKTVVAWLRKLEKKHPLAIRSSLGATIVCEFAKRLTPSQLSALKRNGPKWPEGSPVHVEWTATRLQLDLDQD